MRRDDIEYATDRAVQESHNLREAAQNTRSILSWNFTEDEIAQHEQEIEQATTDRYSQQFFQSKNT